MSSFSPVIRVRKLLEKIKSEKGSPRLKRPSRVMSEGAQENSSFSSFFEIASIPAFKRKSPKFEPNGDNHFELLPNEATLYVFSFLDARDLCRLNQVSKNMLWFSMDELLWKELCEFDWGINASFAETWKDSYEQLEDLFEDGVWEGMSKWIEPAGFHNEQKTTARLHFVKRTHGEAINYAPAPSPLSSRRTKSNGSLISRIPIVQSPSAAYRDAPYKIMGSGVTINCGIPSPFKIEGQRTTDDPTGCTFEWNKQFEKHTSVYSGKMEYATRSVNGVINYNDGATHWKGIFSYTKVRHRGSKLVMA